MGTPGWWGGNTPRGGRKVDPCDGGVAATLVYSTRLASLGSIFELPVGMGKLIFCKCHELRLDVEKQAKNWCVKTFGQIFLELPIVRGLESQILPDGVSRLYNFSLHTLGQVTKGVAAHQTNSTRPGLTIFFNSTRLNISRFLKNQNKRTYPGPGGYIHVSALWNNVCKAKH